MPFKIEVRVTTPDYAYYKPIGHGYASREEAIEAVNLVAKHSFPDNPGRRLIFCHMAKISEYRAE